MAQLAQAAQAWDDLPDWTPDTSSSPDVTTAPSGVPRITIRPRGSGYAPSTPTNAPVGVTATPWSDLSDWTPSSTTPSGPPRDVGTGEAVARGALNAVTFGAAPAIAGLAAAGNATESDPALATAAQQATPAGRTGPLPVLSPVVGAVRMLSDWANGHDDPAVREAYQRGRDSAAQDEQLAQEQHPVPFLLGQLGGAIAGPGFGAVRGTTTLGRIGYGALAGGVGGGLYAGGSDIGAGTPPQQIPVDVAKGAATGAAFGGGGAGLASGVGAVGNKIGNIVRGTRDVEAEAGRRISNALASDLQSQGAAFAPEEARAAQAAGTPLTILNTGGERTRAVARSSANTSPEGRAALTESTSQTFEQQSPRIANFVRALGGDSNATSDAALLEQAGKVVNKPLYKRAYAAGDRPIWSPELERLTGSPDVEAAMARAIKSGKSKAIEEGMGGFNPGVNVTPDGRIIFNQGPRGVPTYPNLQFWDYAQRELSDAAYSAPPGSDAARTLKGLLKQLKNELDFQVPEFGAARATAASFFGAENALEAGQKFVMSNAPIPEAARALAKMSKDHPAARELFARGFASDLADKIERTGDRRNVINSIFLGSPAARQKINLALGPQRAGMLEALLRAETIVDEARKALGNSTTARQLGEMGLAGGAVAAFEGLKEHDFNPLHIITAALTFGAAKKGVHIIDEKVARRVGEMLVSNNPSVLNKGIRIASASPNIMNALRSATASSARVGTHDIGPVNAAAGAIAGAQYLGNKFSSDHENP
jgi:hypothetical protein